ncbi:MAG: DUF2953 domain-containing protein [Butyrivibrio sp.]
MIFLTVFLTILKVAGIAIGVIVGLFLIFVCWFLFMPVRYKGQFSYHGKPDIDIKFGSFGRLVHGYILYRDGNAEGEAIVLWRNLFDDDEEKKARKKAKRKAKKAKKRAKKAQKNKSQKIPETKIIKEPPKAPVKENAPVTETGPETEINKTALLNINKKSGNKKNKKPKKNIFKRLKDRYNRIKAGIKNINETKNRVMAQIRDPENKEAVLYLILMIKKLLKHFRPRKQKFIIEFGTGEPDKTGELLGAMYAMAALLGLNLYVNPDFENKKFELDGLIKGRVCVLWIIVWYVKLCMNEKIYMIIEKLDI